MNKEKQDRINKFLKDSLPDESLLTWVNPDEETTKALKRWAKEMNG